MNDIRNKIDVENLVNTFYAKVLKDDLLAPFFKHLNFDKHLPKMVFFWCFVLLDEPGYTTDVTQKHIHMKLEKRHFKKWLELFHTTINEMFAGEKAEIAKQRATILGWTMESKLQQ